jgi:hypothetical protein
METKSFVGTSAVRRLVALGRVVLLGSLLFWTSCSTSRSTIPVRPGTLVTHPTGSVAQPRSSGAGHTFVLVTLDGVRWEDVYLGVERSLALEQGMSESEILGANALIPNLTSLMTSGAALGVPGYGPGIFASGPNFLSVPGYMEMMTGLRPTGCTTNGCRQVTIPTIADDFAAEPGADPQEVAVIGSWEGLERAAASDESKLTISIGRTRGDTRERLCYDPTSCALLEAGEDAGPEPGHGNYRRDKETSAIALHYLRTHRPRFLFLGLGDTDEYAHKDDYRGYLTALVRADRVIGEVAAILADYAREGRKTTLIVTTDHGRSADFTGHGEDAPESARVWLVASGDGIRATGPVFDSREHHLADVAATIRVLGRVGRPLNTSAPLAALLEPSDPRVALHHSYDGPTE